MAIGRINKMSIEFEAYHYILNGVGGIGKTSMVRDIGELITGSDKGTLVLTLGAEPEPTHIDNIFYEPVTDFVMFSQTIKELTENRKDYPETKFVALDSLDELFRIAEEYVVMEYNNSINTEKAKKAKSISGAYGGYQKGEDRVIDLVIKLIEKLKKHYSVIIIGHTKMKSKTDIYSQTSYEQISCSVSNKYYTAIKDKFNLVATCYNEKVIDNVEDVLNPFTKKKEKKGQLVSEKRVIIFRDDDNAVDTKTHFPHIESKIDFSAENFIKAVEDALIKKKNNDKVEIKPLYRPVTDEIGEVETEETEFKDIDETEVSEIENNVVLGVVEETDNKGDKVDIPTKEEMFETVKSKIKNIDDETKAKVRTILTKNNTTLTKDIDKDILKQIYDIIA